LQRKQRSHSNFTRDQTFEQPSSTAKHNAIVEANRKKIERRLSEEKKKMQEDLQRYIV
jgi:hypothetical protein